jgi:glycosyltransferase involved in cell wall biosynthesis
MPPPPRCNGSSLAIFLNALGTSRWPRDSWAIGKRNIWRGGIGGGDSGSRARQCPRVLNTKDKLLFMSTLTAPRHIVLLLGWYYPDSVGGTERYTRMLARDLRVLGYRITIVAPSRDDQEQHYEYDGVPVYRYPIDVMPTTSEVQGKSPPRYFDVFARWLDEVRPDVVHLHSLTRACGFFHARYIKSLGVPLCLTVHVPGVTCALGTMRRWSRVSCDGEMRVARCTACVLHDKGVPRVVGYAAARIPARLARLAGRWRTRLSTGLQMAELVKTRGRRVHALLAMADHVVVVSQWLYDVLRSNGVAPDKLTLSRHGLPQEVLPVPAAPRSVPQPSLPLRVGYVGRFHPPKGVHVLIEAIRRLPVSTPITLHLYGAAAGPEEQHYLATVRRQAEGDARIAFMGEMTEQNRDEVLTSFDVLAVPSTGLETGPLVVLEAFAAGIPVIGSDSGGIAELVTHGESGLLVRTGKSEAWTQALREIAEQWKQGQWTWHLPPVRESADVARDMRQVYENLWAKSRSAGVVISASLTKRDDPC